MTRYRSVFVALFVVLFVAGCQVAEHHHPTDSAEAAGLTPEDIATIEASSKAWVDAALAGDWESLAHLYAPDGILMPPNVSVFEGRDAIREYFEGMPTIIEFDLETLELDGRSDLAYLRGRYTMTLALDGGGSVVDSGKYLEIRRKMRDGSWPIHIDTFNSDLPLDQ